MNFPEDLKYTNDHEWIKVDGNIGTIGITDHAQSELGDIVYIDIDEGMTDFSAGDTLGTIEAVKTVADFLAPVSGKIAEINSRINDNPEIVNNDPYGDGWIVKIELSDIAQLDNLLDVNAYKEIIGQ